VIIVNNNLPDIIMITIPALLLFKWVKYRDKSVASLAA